MADYAADLLGSSAPQPAAPPPAAPTDYASGLLGGKKSTNDRFSDALKKDVAGSEGSADFGTLTKAAMVEDPQTKLRIFAKGRFPKLDEKEALSRYGIVDGEVLYVDDNGDVHKENPSGVSGAAKRLAANTVADAPAIIGGTVGAALSAPSGPGMIAGGAAGAAVGKAGGKAIANVAFDEPQTPADYGKAMGSEALFSVGGNLIGLGLAKVLTRGAARDIARLDPQAIAELQRKAAAQGVDLNVAQQTNLPSLKAKYDVLASMPTSRDAIAADAEKQSRQAYVAAGRFLANVSPTDGLDEAGAQARKGATKVIAKLTKERSAAAKPLYKAAFDGFQEFSEDEAARLAQLRTSPSFRQAERLADRLYQDDVATMGAKDMPQLSALRDLHYTKLALDKMIGDEAKGGYSKTSRGALVGLKNELLSVMDEASPAYAKARETFAHMTPNIQSVQDGIISRVAGLGDEQAFKAANMMFGGNTSPIAVDRAKRLFEKAGLKEDWDAMLRAHLQDTFEKAGREFKTAGGALEQAPNWRAALAGNPRQYRILEKAMDPVQFAAFNDMMDVFQAMGRTSGAGAGSQTMTRLEGREMLSQDSGSGVIGQVARLGSPQNIGNRVGDWLAEVRLGDHAEKLAEVMTSPDGIRKLRDLRKLSPRDQRFIAGASALFGIELKPSGKPADTGTEQAQPQ